MSPRVLQGSPLPHGVIVAAAAFASLILLVTFYSVVSGAVERAAIERRAAVQLEAAARAAADARFAARQVLVVQAAPPRMAQRFSPRPVAYRSAQ